MRHVPINKARIRVTAKSHLTDKQYYGGPNLTPTDNATISNILLLCFGNYKFEVPPVQWGFEAWANYIGWKEAPISKIISE